MAFVDFRYILEEFLETGSEFHVVPATSSSRTFVEELEGLYILHSMVVRVGRVVSPFANGGVHGSLNDGLIEIDNEGELLRG